MKKTAFVIIIIFITIIMSYAVFAAVGDWIVPSEAEGTNWIISFNGTDTWFIWTTTGEWYKNNSSGYSSTPGSTVKYYPSYDGENFLSIGSAVSYNYNCASQGIIDGNCIVYSNNTLSDILYNFILIEPIEHLYGEVYNTDTDITRDFKYNDVEFDVLIQEEYIYFLANISYENLYLHVYEASEFMLEGYEYIDEYDEIETGDYYGCELKYTRTIDIGEKLANEIFQVSIEDIGMNSHQDGYVLLFSENGQSLYDSWDPMPYYSYGEIWDVDELQNDFIADYIINPSGELITDEEYPMFFFSYNKTGEIAVSEDPYIHSPDENKLITGDLSLYWYNYTGYMQMVNLTTNNFYENIDYDLIVPATDDYINIWSAHDKFTKIPWNCNEQERLIYGPITDYFPLKDGENIIEVYNSQSQDMSNKTMIYRFMVKYAQDELIPVNVDGEISRGTANAFSTIFRAINETLKLIDRASFGINSSEPGFFMELSSIPACDELLNDDIKDGLNFLKNQKIVLFEKEYIFYDLFTFVMTFIFGFVVIAIFKNQILGIASTIKGNLTLPGKDVTRGTYRDKRDWIYTRRG